MRILHRDRGRAWHGGQFQMKFLVEGLRAAGVDCGVDSPLWREPIDSFDLLHCHDGRSHTFARKPFVVSRRVGFPVGTGWASRWKYARPEAFLAVSRYVADELMKVGVPAKKIHIVPDGVPLTRRADRRSGRVLLLSKNGMSIPGAVPVRRLEEDLLDCDVFVYLSDMEGLGSAAIRAQAAGVPVVATRAGGLPEAVLFGRVIDSVDQAAAAIETARSIEVDVARVEREFGIAAVVARTMAVYREVLA